MLAMLLAKPGQVVTREELQQELWPNEEFGEFDLGLNTAVKKLRQALNDSADSPRWVETIPKVGYKFLAPVETASAAKDARAIPAPASGNPSDAVPAAAERTADHPSRALLGGAAVAFLAAAVALGWLWGRSDFENESRPVRRFSFTHPGVGSAIISPDGLHIAFSARGESGRYSIWLRSLESEAVRELPGTQGVDSVIGAWSPDSRSILFGTDLLGADDQLRRVAIDGGDPVVLCTLPEGRRQYPFVGGTYSLDGERIVFSSRMRLWEIPAQGGEPRLVFEPEAPAYWAPQFLPAGDGSRYLIYSAATDSACRTELFDFQTGERREIAPGKAGTYAPSGFVVHGHSEIRRRGLFAMPFSLTTFSATGDSIPLAESTEPNSISSVTQEGTLVYVDRSAGGVDRIVVRDRTGEIVQSVGEPAVFKFTSPAVSPDGRRAAVIEQGAIWVYDLDRNVRTRLTVPGDDLPGGPTWLPSGREVAFPTRGGKVMIQTADGSVAAFVAYEANSTPSFSRDGRYVAYNAQDPSGGEGGIWYREIAADGSFSEPISWLRTPDDEQQPRISPNGEYLAYQSNESGRFDIYVRPFAEGPGKWLVSTNGGRQPSWSADGKELFYTEGPALMAVPVETAGMFTAGTPERLFEALETTGNIAYDVFPDGQRFITIRREGARDAIRIVENWAAPFRDREQD